MPRNAKNKMKAWRKNSPGDHMGRQMKYMTMGHQIGVILNSALMTIFANANIPTPKPTQPSNDLMVENHE